MRTLRIRNKDEGENEIDEQDDGDEDEWVKEVFELTWLDVLEK